MADYFIDPSRAVNGTGSEGDPYNALPALTSNNRYFFRRGTTLTVTSQITRPGGVNSVTFDAYGEGDLPHIRGVFDPTDATQSTIQLANSAGWAIRDLRISRSLPDVFRAIAVLDLRGATVKDANLLIEGCLIEGGGDSVRLIDNLNNVTLRRCVVTGAFTDGFWARSGNNVVVEWCEFYGQGAGDETNSDPIQFSEHTGLAVVRNCVVTMRDATNKQGIFFQTSAGGYSIAERNIVIKPGGGGASIAIEGAGAIRRNLIRGQTLRGASITSKADGQDAIIECNVIEGDWAGASYGVYLAGEFAKQARVRNNTIVGRWQRGVFIGAGALPGVSTYSGANNVIDCMDNPGSVAIRNDSGVSVISSSDCIVRASSNAGANVTLNNLVTADPLLDANFRPLLGSPLIGAGTHIGYRRDFDGKQRPNPPSIGAFDVARVKSAP